MSIRLRHLASLPLLLLAACSVNNIDVEAVDAGLDWPSAGGVTSTGGMNGSGGAISTGGLANRTCDPLAPGPTPISWATIIAGGRSANGTVYAADEANGVGRVFVSDASGALVRQRVAGSGTGPGMYTFSVTGADMPFVLQIETSATGTRIGVLQGTLTDRKTIVIGQDGEELTVVPNATIAGMPVRNLPGAIVAEYVDAQSQGGVLLVTRPRDDWSYQDFRLFLGPPSAIRERHVVSVVRLKDGGTTTIVFDLDGVPATAHFPVIRSDAGGGPDPATLTVGDVVTPLDRKGTLPGNATYLCLANSPSATCVSLTSVSDQCPADWEAAIADQIAFCAKEAPFFGSFLSTVSCRGGLHYTKYLFDAGPRYCVYHPATRQLVGYRAFDGKALFEKTSCGLDVADFDDQGCVGMTCATRDASTPPSD